MPSRLFSALQRHPKLSRPRRRAADAPQPRAVEAQADAAAPDSAELAAPAVAAPKPRRTRTPSCIRVSSRFRYTTASHGEHVPFMRLSGHWLEKYGFNIEGDVHIEAEHGRLILTNHPTHMAKVWASLP
jgi:hypothetical protein